MQTTLQTYSHLYPNKHNLVANKLQALNIMFLVRLNIIKPLEPLCLQALAVLLTVYGQPPSS